MHEKILYSLRNKVEWHLFRIIRETKRLHLKKSALFYIPKNFVTVVNDDCKLAKCNPFCAIFTHYLPITHSRKHCKILIIIHAISKDEKESIFIISVYHFTCVFSLCKFFFIDDFPWLIHMHLPLSLVKIAEVC